MAYDYERFKVEIKRITKIDLNAYKERQMKRRIDSLIEKNGYKGYEDFVSGLLKDTALLKTFVNYLTINVSEFYRNPAQWKILEEDILPKIIEQAGPKLRIWSAACSTGDEPYTIAMILAKRMPFKDIHIVATDLDEEVIRFAKNGVYSERSIAGLPNEYLVKYFQKTSSGMYQITDDIIRCVEFKKHNLLLDSYPTNMDLIVCRNVLIYFTEEAKNQIYRKFKASLNDYGVLFIGNTEQIIKAKEIGFESYKSFFYSKRQ